MISSSTTNVKEAEMAHRGMRPSVVRLILLLNVIVAATIYVRGSTPPSGPPSEGPQIGKILSVRKILENRFVGSRYPQIHYYLLYFAVRTSDQTYCAEYEIPVLDEIDELFSAKDQNAGFVLKGKSLTLRTLKGRKIKAHLVEQRQCLPHAEAWPLGVFAPVALETLKVRSR